MKVYQKFYDCPRFKIIDNQGNEEIIESVPLTADILKEHDKIFTKEKDAYESAMKRMVLLFGGSEKKWKHYDIRTIGAILTDFVNEMKNPIKATSEG
jgi:hypothetical protein